MRLFDEWRHPVPFAHSIFYSLLPARNIYGNTAEHAKGKAMREDSIRQGIVGHSISDAGALI